VHETEIRNLGAAAWVGVHLVPLKERICPSKFVAMQKCGVEHDTLNSRSSIVPVEVDL
jgi:hypothetical protein